MYLMVDYCWRIKHEYIELLTFKILIIWNKD